ncbi:uncharacterized protein EI97DRAFT_375261 [Westerdykella ornata]|uniref:MGS207 protein n=1 Tax=Westerdykella ornata TaxID=318751 RepID=A0A6A6JRE9_WESOR|nr:uncharacterized protein EI97DRAFT_375261 [Westerdykella ornata]KAF2277509.1 hypothetical protein EI97DRAFT_375261 [Westerdykella ornata]
MFQLPRFKIPFFGGQGSSPSDSQRADCRFVKLASVPIHDVETSADRRARSLKHLLKANHANHSILYNQLRFHNHAPHLLGSAYLLGASHEELHDIYEKEAEELEPWSDSPGEISKDDWRGFLGKREYQRAFVDFFEDQLVAKRYDWKLLLDEYLFQGREPLINGIIAGLAHPLIHLGYAYELNSRTVAIEALALAACCYNSLHKYIDDPAYTKPGEFRSQSLLDILNKVREDKRFDGLYDHRSGDISKVLVDKEGPLLEYWNAWELTDPTAQFRELQRTATAVFLATEPPASAKFDFFLVHLLTSSHAVRILLPLVPHEHHVSLLRQWWLFTLAVYIAQTRPAIDLELIEGYGRLRDWESIRVAAVSGEHRSDAHFVKALRAMGVANETWADDEGDLFYQKAASKFCNEFEHWGGFGTADDVTYPEFE